MTPAVSAASAGSAADNPVGDNPVPHNPVAHDPVADKFFADQSDRALVLFDGVCNLCNAAVLFIIDRDPRGRFRFAPLQSDHAVQLLASLGAQDLKSNADSIVLIEEGRVYLRSDAALRICSHLRSPWPVMSWFLIVPRQLRDWVYDWVARNRYRWFGRQESCRIPTPELRERFLA